MSQLALLRGPSIVPRPYQEAAVDATFDNWKLRPSSAQIIVAPTGSGKTVMIGMAAERYLSEAQGGRVLVLAHVPELVEQSYVTFRQMFPAMSSGIYAAKLGRKDRRTRVTFALVQSVARNIEAFRDCGLIMIDEAHLVPHSSDGQYRAVIDGIREARGHDFVKILGLTATPWRLNSGNLLEPYKDQPPLFDEISYEIDMLDLIEEGNLSKVVTRATKMRMDAKGVHKRGGEYIDSELDAKFNNDRINKAIAKETVEAGIEQDRKSWLVFCITVDHATRMRDMIRQHGVSCEMICGETPMGERRRIISAYKQFKIRCLTSVNVLSTGFDHKGVDLIAMARPTNSPGLYLQQAGRALRTFPGKADALLLDFSANVFRHGLLTSVKGVFKKRKKEDEDEEAAVKECPSCSTVVAAGTRTCPQCGHVWEMREKPDREAKLSGKNMATRVMDEASNWVDVLDANYRATAGGPEKPSVLVLSYRVMTPDRGPITATESFCLDHPGDSWALKKGRQEWVKRTGLYAPTSVAEGVTRISELRRPAKVRVVQSDCGRYFNVRGVKFA